MTAHRPRKQGHADEALIDVLFGGAYSTGTGWLTSRRAHGWRPPTDVYETEETIVVRVEIAGMRRDDFYISLQDRHLSIAGHRAHEHGGTHVHHQLEVNYGDFRTEVDLPMAVVADGVEAVYEEGFLRVTLPKLLPRNVTIR
jgi:HSP20 family protein